MMGDRFGLGVRISQRLGRAAVQRLPPALKQAVVHAASLNKRVLEAITGLWWRAFDKHEIGFGELLQRRLQRRLVQFSATPRNSCVGEVASKNSPDSASPRAPGQADLGAPREIAAVLEEWPERRPARRAPRAVASPPRRTGARHRALAGPLDHFLGERMAGRDLADHACDAPARSSGREKSNCGEKAQTPRRAELRASRSQEEQRGLRATVGERAVGRVTSGRPSAGPRRRARPLASARPQESMPSSPPVACAVTPQVGRSRALRRQRNVYERREQGRVFGRVEADQPAACSSRSARRCSAGASTPKRCRPHSAIGCSGVFCRSCEALHLAPGM